MPCETAYSHISKRSSNVCKVENMLFCINFSIFKPVAFTLHTPLKGLLVASSALNKYGRIGKLFLLNFLRFNFRNLN